MLHTTEAEWRACDYCAHFDLSYDGPADSDDSSDAGWDETLAGPEYRMWRSLYEFQTRDDNFIPFPWGLPCE